MSEAIAGIMIRCTLSTEVAELESCSSPSLILSHHAMPQLSKAVHRVLLSPLSREKIGRPNPRYFLGATYYLAQLIIPNKE